MKKTSILAIGMLLLCAAVTRAETARFAIVIGQNASDSDKIPDLRYADDDAVATHRLFAQAGIESVLLVSLDEDSRGLHPDLQDLKPPSRENLLGAFGSLAERMKAIKAGGGETEFLLVYSGHGNVEHGEGYIVLFNGGRLSRGDLYDEILAPSPADRNHVIVDACKSYYLAFEKGPGGERQPYNRHFVDRPDTAGAKNTGFLLSTSSDRDSHEWERFQAGIFSHELRSALRGGADVDGNLKITYAELGAFLTTANEHIKNPRFRPDFVVSPPGELSQDIIDWTKNRDVLVLDDTSWGHVYLENSTGDRLMDINPEEGGEFFLQLPVERPLFVRRADESCEKVVKTAGVVRMSIIPTQTTRIRRKGALHLAFEKLFSEPFGMRKLETYSERFVPKAEANVEIVSAEAPAPFLRHLKTAALWTAIGSAALGAAANIYAFERYNSGENASPTRKMEINRDIENLNTVAIVFYSLAGVAAATWLTLTLWPDESEKGVDVTFIPNIGMGEACLGVIVQIGY